MTLAADCDLKQPIKLLFIFSYEELCYFLQLMYFNNCLYLMRLRVYSCRDKHYKSLEWNRIEHTYRCHIHNQASCADSPPYGQTDHKQCPCHGRNIWCWWSPSRILYNADPCSIVYNSHPWCESWASKILHWCRFLSR